MKKIAVILFSLLVAACASTHKADTTQASANENKATTSSPASAPAAAEAEMSASKLKAEIEELQKESVYFDFDKYLVKPQFQATIQKQAEFLKSHGNDVVTLQGNCDERGSAEYNLALGSERAQAVEKDLEILGVPASQMKVVSFGEEKPRLTCHAEKCWKENRRVDFVHDVK